MIDTPVYYIPCVCFGVALAFFIGWRIARAAMESLEEPDKLYITFDRFIALYSIAPHKWRLHPSWVGYLLDGPKTRDGWATVNETTLYMIPKEWKKYDKWLSEKKRMEQAKEQNEKEAEIIQHWQKDIDHFREGTK